MDDEKYDAIENFLLEEFPGAQVQHGNVALDRGFRCLHENEIYILRIGREFIEDHDGVTIVEMLRQWHVGDYLRENRSLGVLITSNGPETYALG